MTKEQIAQVCHEANRTYCRLIGDDSQLPWDQAPNWQRESAIRGVEFALANPHATPSAQHNAWFLDKNAAGWKYGPVKNPDIKEHPCMLPYDSLPFEQRQKDYLFRAVVRGLTDLVAV